MGMASRLVDLRQAGVADGQVNKSTSGHVDLLTPPRYQRKTYYLRPDQVDRIEAMAFHEKLDLSEVVRLALDTYLEAHGL